MSDAIAALPSFESPLAHRTAAPGLAVSLREIADRGMIDLRGQTTDRKFMAAAKAVLGVDLPKAPRSSAAWGDIRVLWLSVDQWLVLVPRDKAVAMEAGLRKALDGVHALAVNVSDMRAIMRIEGEAARETLLKGSSLDLLSEDYGQGTVRRLRFAEIAALLHVVEDDVFDIYVFRSYADYAWDFLETIAKDAARVRLFGKQATPA
jgi:sarcosine oxidase subunit gamma